MLKLHDFLKAEAPEKDQSSRSKKSSDQTYLSVLSRVYPTSEFRIQLETQDRVQSLAIFNKV